MAKRKHKCTIPELAKLRVEPAWLERKGEENGDW